MLICKMEASIKVVGLGKSCIGPKEVFDAAVRGAVLMATLILGHLDVPVPVDGVGP